MATTTISDLWVPAEWISALRERQATFPVLFQSKVVARAPLFDTIASGPGTSVNIPFLKDITDQTDELQVENTAPTGNNNQPGSTMVAVPRNTVTKNSSTALAAQLSGADPMAAIIDQMLARRMKQRQTTLLAMSRGLLGTGSTNGLAGAALGAMRLGGTAEPFTEDGNNATSDQLFSPDHFINMKASMGELANDLYGGVLWVHPNIKARLEKLDALNFRTLVKPSELPFDIVLYRDIPIVTSESLVRAGTQSGYVYDSYLLAAGIVAFGEKPQAADTADVASLAYFYDRDLNNEIVWDRNRTILHLNGAKWTGTAANANNGPSNAELQTVGNWALAFQTANRCGITAARTNG